MAKKKEVKFTLKNWSLIVDGTNPFQDPAILPMMAQGEVYGNDKFEDGKRITTSYIKDIKYDENKLPIEIVTNNSIYILEDISETYKAYLDSVRQQ